MDKRIVVLQRGWVAVGDFSQVGTQCKLANAAIVRRWGTEKGLGELAKCGPLENTRLDKCPDLEFHELTVCFTMNCNQENWK